MHFLGRLRADFLGRARGHAPTRASNGRGTFSGQCRGSPQIEEWLREAKNRMEDYIYGWWRVFGPWS